MAKNFIKNAIKNKGGLHKALGVPMGQVIPATKMNQAINSNDPHIKKMAQLAKTLKGLHKG